MIVILLNIYSFYYIYTFNFQKKDTLFTFDKFYNVELLYLKEHIGVQGVGGWEGVINILLDCLFIYKS